jgi:hypothetical protein
MAEIYLNTNSPLKHKIFWQGEIVDADSAPVVKIYDITEDVTITPAISPTTILTTITSTKIETDYGNYQVVIPLSFVQRQRNFKLVWEYAVGGVSASGTTYAQVVTPYTNIYEAIDELNIGVDQSDPNYKTFYQIQQAEKYARKVIEDYTGQDFFLYDDVEVAYGMDSDILSLPYKITSVQKLYGNDILLVDNTVSPVVNNWLYTPQITESGFGIRIDRTNLLDNTVYVANGMVPPTINDSYTGQAFNKHTRYRVYGRYGWESVPDNVQMAAKELMKDYFSKDLLWKQKYLKNVQTFDWKFEYTGQAYSGTGNQYADQLLNPYIITSMVLI